MESNLKKGIITLLSVNIINLIFNLLTNFLLPKYLSVESYAAIKTFQLYTTYIGVFSLGCSDGMYLRYGGKNLKLINQFELQTSVKTFRLFMFLESIVVIPIALFIKDKVFIIFTMTILSMNMISYFKNLYEAVGEFEIYGKILNWTTVANFIVNMFLLICLRTDEYAMYLLGYVVVDIIIWLVLELNIRRFLVFDSRRGNISITLLFEDIKAGILLLIGNFSNILLSSMDRWFVKFMMTAIQFAQYSFAVSMEGFLNVAISPITTALYNYLCIHSEKKEVLRVRRYVMLFGSMIVMAAFPAKFIIEIYLQEYQGAIGVLFFLFATQMIYIMIKGVYVNLYKALKQQNKYFFRLVLILIIGAVLNVLLVKFYPHKEAFALGTLLSAIIWMILCIYDFKEYTYSLREWIFIIFEIVVFVLCGMNLSALIGLIVYGGITLMMMRLFMKEEFQSILTIGKDYIKKQGSV